MQCIINFFRHIFYDAAVFGQLSVPRSSRWKKTREEHIKNNPTCFACGRSEYLTVHHITPFHIEPNLELAPDNLLTLCQGKGLNCHFVFGHRYNWTTHNPDVKKDCISFREIITSWHK
jgi:5-methylcytosine-specific restriction endonuclease McrA